MPSGSVFFVYQIIWGDLSFRLSEANEKSVEMIFLVLLIRFVLQTSPHFVRSRQQIMIAFTKQ